MLSENTAVIYFFNKLWLNIGGVLHVAFSCLCLIP